MTGGGAGEAAEAGFTALVDRHGPMVLRVCQRILCDRYEAEDAFQATFLILVRKAGSVRKRDSVASWLHGIARRVAMRSRSDRSRRLEYERRGAAMASRAEARSPDEPECWSELHEEVARLPGQYRESVVLCYLEGLTTEEAAGRLGCPQGTILSRLSRARDRLRDRLTRRGLAIPARLFADVPRAVAVPPTLSHAVIQSALKLAADGAATSIAPTSVAGPIRGVLRTMTLSRLGLTAAAFATVAILAACEAALLPSADDAAQREAQAGTGPPRSPLPLASSIGRIRALLSPDRIPEGLSWSDVPPEQRVQVLEFLAAQTRANYERIQTWRGTYTFRRARFVPESRRPRHSADRPPIEGAGQLAQDVEGPTSFAIHMAYGNIFRDTRCTDMTLHNPGRSVRGDLPRHGEARRPSHLPGHDGAR